MKPQIYFTFDDGPNPWATEEISDILKFYKINATFFVIGRWASLWPNIILRLKKNGHHIGNHTFTHSIGDFKKCHYVLKKFGIRNSLIRPPFFRKELCGTRYLYQRIILGDCDPCDYNWISAQEIHSNVMSSVRENSIITFHDGSDNYSELKTRPLQLISALPLLIEELKGRYDINPIS